MTNVRRPFFCEQQWFLLEGQKKNIAKLPDEAIVDACKKIISQRGEEAVSETLGDVCIKKMGAFSYFQPHEIVEKHWNLEAIPLFGKLLKTFFQFVEFVTGKKLQEMERQKMDLRFAMQVFASDDDEFMEKLFDGKQGVSSLTFSKALTLWVDSLSELSRYDKDVEEKLPVLRKIIEYQRSIEDLRAISRPHKRMQERNKITTQIKKDISSLEVGKSLYIPGGIWDEDNSKSLPMLYEICKQKDGSFEVKATDFSGEIFEKDTSKKPREDDREVMVHQIEKLLDEETQVKKASIQSGINIPLEGIEGFVDEATLMLSGRATPPQLSSGFFSFFWLYLEQKIWGEEETAHVKKTEIVRKRFHQVAGPEGEKKPQLVKSPVKLARVFTRSLAPEKYKKWKLEIRTKYLLSLWDRAGSSLNDIDFRNFIAKSALKLVKDLKVVGAEKKKDSLLLADLEHILTEIARMDSKQEISMPTSQILAQAQKTEFEEPISPKAPIIPLSMVSKREIKPSRPTTVELNVDSLKANVVPLKRQVELLKIMAGRKEYTTLHAHLHDICHILRMLNESDIYGIAQGEKTKEWADALRDLGFLIQRTSYGLRRVSPSPEDIANTLYCLKLQDQICRLNPVLKDDPYVEGFVFDMAPIEKILKNPYISLGEYSKEIFDVIAYFKGHSGKTPIRGFRCTEKPPSDADANFFKLYVKEPHTNVEALQDINGDKKIIPPYLVNLRQSYLLLQTFVAPTRTFLPLKRMQVISIIRKAEKKVVGSSYAQMMALAAKIGYKETIEAIPNFLLEKDGPIEFSIKKPEAYNNPSARAIEIAPWNLSIFDIDDKKADALLGSRLDFPHLGTFDHNGVPVVDQWLREHSFEQVVSENSFSGENLKTHGSNDDGVEVVSSKSEGLYLDHRLVGKTEWQILQDKERIMGLSPYVSQELQLMETGTHTIVQNTLSFISQNIALLNDETCGPSIGRLVERNFFKNNAFLLLPEREQQIAFTELKRLIDNAKVTENAFAAVQLIGMLRLMYVNMDSTRRKNVEQIFIAAQMLLLNSDMRKIAQIGNCERELLLEQLIMNDTIKRIENKSLLTEDDIIERIFSFSSLQGRRRSEDPLKEERVREIIQGILPVLRETLRREASAFCSKICAGLHVTVPDEPLDWKRRGPSGFVFQKDGVTIDFSRFEVWIDGVRKGPLPVSVTELPAFSTFERLIREVTKETSIQDRIWEASPVVIPGENAPGDAMQYSIQLPGYAFRIIVGADGSSRLYRQKEGGRWYQYEPEIFGENSDKVAPRVIEDGDCFVREDCRELLVEKGGVPEWVATLSGGTSLWITELHNVSMDKKSPRAGKRVLNAAATKEFSRFCDISSPSYVTVFEGVKNRPQRIEYGQFNEAYSYVWRNDRFESEQKGGYFLSDKTLESYATPQTLSDTDSRNISVEEGMSRLRKLFHPTFRTYHFLESTKNNLPLLVIPRVSFQKAEKGKAQQWIPQFGTDTLSTYEFEVSCIKGLVPKKQPEGYLYLAYLLTVQGNYKDAFIYLEKANFHKKMKDEGIQVLQWMEDVLKTVPQNNTEALMLKTRFFLMRGEASGEKDTLIGLQGQVQSIQAKKLLDMIKANRENIREGMDLTMAEERQLSLRAEESLASFIYSIAKDPEKWERVKSVKNMLQELFKGSTGDAFSEYEKLRRLQATKEWQDFEKEVLQPFHFGMKELFAMHKEGGLSVLFETLGSKDAFSEDLLKQLIVLSEKRENFSLRAHIKSLEQEIQKRTPKDQVKLDINPKDLFTGVEKDSWEECFDTPSVSSAASKLTAAIVEKSVPPSRKDSETYEEQLNRELKEDVVYYIKKSPDFSPEIKEVVGVEKKDIPSAPKEIKLGQKEVLRSAVRQFIKVKENAVEHRKKECIFLLKNWKKKPAGEDIFSYFEKKFRRVGRVTPEALFDTAIQCFGENDFSRLEKMGVVFPSEEGKEELRKSLRDFLKFSIQTKQLQTVQAKMNELDREQSEEGKLRISREVASLLDAKWQYDVDKDPLSPTILLVEYELGFICRESQLKVIQENLKKENCFKQEICGGGKTTVLRNIISQIRADGVTLSGVSTLSPLRAEHGLLYARTTKNAYGGRVFDFRFDRTSPSDETSLLYLKRSLLETDLDKGRLDLSKGDLQSFKLAGLLKNEEVREKRAEIESLPIEMAERKKVLEAEIDRLHRELNVMEDIRDFLLNSVAIMADELDRDCDPTQEKNYSYGKEEVIDTHKRGAIMRIMEQLFKVPEAQELAKAVKTNSQAKLDPEIISQALKGLAGSLYHGYEAHCTKEEFIAYVLEPKTLEAEREAVSIYNKIFKEFIRDRRKPLPPDLQTLAYMRQFLSEVLPHGLAKTGGVAYGRSKDEVTVIPYAGSDKPKEGSLHGNDMERLFYTCMDYVQKGVSGDLIRSALIQAQQEAIQEVLSAQRENKVIAIDETKSAARFKDKFLKYVGTPSVLSEVRDRDIERIRAAITSKEAVFFEFLRETILPELRQSERKIISDAQDPPEMVKYYSGSSGTDTGKYALPDKISKKDVRQDGVHGEAIRWLKETEVSQGSEKSFILGGMEPYNLLSSNMKGGDCISDVGRLFPGIPPKVIAEKLFAVVKDDIQFIVFMDEKDEWKMLRRQGSSGFEQVDYFSSEDPSVLGRRLTIFDDVHTRGAERSSMAGVTEYVTLDIDTNWSRFEQAVLRERNVTKGKASVRYILTPEMHEKFGEDFSVDKLIELLNVNEAKELQALNYKAERQKIKHILKRFGEKALREISFGGRASGGMKHALMREKLYAEISQLYVISNKIDVLQAGAPQANKSTGKVLDELVDDQIARLDSVVNNLRGADPTLNRVSVKLVDMKDDLKTLSENMESIISSVENIKEELEGQKGQHLPAKEREKACELLQSKDLVEKMKMLKEKKELMKKMLSDIENMSTAGEELGFDIVSVIKKELESVPKQLRDILTKIQDAKSQLDAGGVWVKIGDWWSGGAFSAMSLSLGKIDKACSDTVQTIETIQRKGTPLIDNAIAVLEEARPFLIAKYSLGKIGTFRLDVQSQAKKLIEKGFGRVDAAFLPKEVKAGTGDLDNEQEIEQELEAACLPQELGKEADVGKIFEHMVLTVPPLLDLVQGKECGRGWHRLSDFSPLQPKNKYFTENCFPVDRSEKKIHPWGPGNIPTDQKIIERSLFIIHPLTGAVAEVFGSQLDNDRMLLPEKLKREGYKVVMFNYGLDKVDSGDSLDDLDLELAEQVMQYIVTTKLQRGDCSFPGIGKEPKTAKEVFLGSKEALVTYLKTLSPENLLALESAMKTIIAQQKSRGTFEGSDLQKAFHEVKNKK